MDFLLLDKLKSSLLQKSKNKPLEAEYCLKVALQHLLNNGSKQPKACSFKKRE